MAVDVEASSFWKTIYYIKFKMEEKRCGESSLLLCGYIWGTTVVNMMKMGVMIPLALVVELISYDPEETLDTGIPSMMMYMISYCRLGDSGYGIQNPCVCCDSLEVCAD